MSVAVAEADRQPDPDACPFAVVLGGDEAKCPGCPKRRGMLPGFRERPLGRRCFDGAGLCTTEDRPASATRGPTLTPSVAAVIGGHAASGARRFR